MSGRLSKAISIILTCAVIITTLPVNVYGKGLMPGQGYAVNPDTAYLPAQAYFFVNNSTTTTLTAAEDGSVTFDLSVSLEGAGSGVPVEITMMVKDYVFPGDGTTPPGYYQLLRGQNAYYGATWSESDPGYLQNVRIPDVKPGVYEVVIYTSAGGNYLVENAVTISAAGNPTPPPESEHTVRFFLNGGTGKLGEDYGTRSLAAGAAIILPAAPSRPGHSFAGWRSAGTLYRAGTSYTVREDTDFSADWGVMDDVIVRFPEEITGVVGYLWMTGTYLDASGTEREEWLWQKDYARITAPEDITLNQWKIYDRSYTGLKVLTYVDGAETVIAEYDGTQDPVTDSRGAVQLTAKGGPYLPVTGLKVTGLESGKDYLAERISGKAGDYVSLPCMTESGEGFQVKLRGSYGSSAYERYYWEKPYPAKLSGDRLVVTPLEIADAVAVIVSLTDSGETAGWKTVTATQEIGGVSRTVNGYAEGDGKTELNLLPGYDALFSVDGCYIKSGETLTGDSIRAGAEHALDIGEAYLTAEIELTTPSEEDTVSRYLEGLTGYYSADRNASLEIGNGDAPDRADIRMSGKKSSQTVRLCQTATASSLPVTLSGYAVVSPDPQTVELNDGSAEVSFQAALRPGALVNLSGDTRGSYYMAWYDRDGAFAGKTDISLSLGSPHDFGILGPVDKTGNSLTGDFTLVLIPAAYEPAISGSSLSTLTEEMKMAQWQVELRENVITTLEAVSVGAAEGKNALYVTQPASAISSAKDSFADLRELVTFTGSIGLDDGLTDGKLMALSVHTGGSRVSATANVRSLVIGGEVCEPTSSHASFGKTEYIFSDPIDLPCNFTLYCEPESVEDDMEVSVTSSVEYSLSGSRQIRENQLVGEATVVRPGSALYTPSTYVCSERVKLSGTVGAYEDVTIFDNDVRIGTAKGDKHGEWMALVPLYRADTGESRLSTTHALYTMSASGVRSQTLTVFHQADGPELRSLTMEWGDASGRRKINIGEAYSGYNNMKDLTITAEFEHPDALDTMPGWDSPVVFKIYSWHDIKMYEGIRGADGSYTVNLGDTDGGEVMQVNVLYLPKLRLGTAELDEGKSYRLTATLQDEQDMAELFDALPIGEMPASGSYSIDFSGDTPDLSKALPEGLDLPFTEEDLAKLQKNFADAGVNLRSYLAKFGDDTKDADDLPAWISGLSTLRCENAAWYTRTVQFRSDDADTFQSQKEAIAAMADEHTEVIYPGNSFHADRYVLSDAVMGVEADFPYEPGIESLTWCIVADFLTAPGDGLYAANVNVLLNGSGFHGFTGREFDQSVSKDSFAAPSDEGGETVPDIIEDGEIVPDIMEDDELTVLFDRNYNGKFTESLTYDGNCNIESGTGIVSGSLGTITPYMQAAKMNGGAQLGLVGTGLTAWSTFMTIENKNHRRNIAWKLRDELLDLRYLSPCARKIMANDPELSELMKNCIDEYDKVYKKFRCTDDYITYTSVLGNVTATVLGAVPTPVTQLGSVGVSGLTTGFSLFTSQFVSEGYENLIKSYERQHETLRRLFRRYAQKHTGDPNAKDCLEGKDGDGREAWVSWDPSGIVYEGVKENPVANAAVTLYMAVDRDGDAVPAGKEDSVSSLLPPEGVPGVIPRETTLVTGEDGYYEWLVPKGLWFVTAQHSGLYGDSNADRAATSTIAGTQAGRRTATRLLPVLPPQLDVNIPLIDRSAPLVEKVEYTGEGIKVTWNKYMKEGSGAASVLEKANYSVSTAQDETLAIKSVTPVLRGHAPSNIDQSETTYTRTVLLETTEPLPKGVPLTLIISGSVESYASSAMDSDYTGGGRVGGKDDHGDDGKDFRIEGLESSYVYTGFPIIPQISVYDSGILLKEGKDYQVSFRNNTKANDSASLTLKGKGNYRGPVVKGFAITRASLSADNAAVSAFYTTKGSKRTVLVYYNGQKLKEKRDYMVSSDGMRITGTGNFMGERTVTEAAVTLLAIGKTTISLQKSVDYTGEEITPALSVKTKQGEMLTEGTHYKVLCTGNRDTGKATIRIIGLESAGYTGVVKKTFRILPVSMKSEKISIRVDATAEYAKGGAKPDITITYDNGDHIKQTLREGADYIVKYKNNANAGLVEKTGGATLTLKGVGNYKDTVSRSFTVTKTSIASLKPGIGNKQYKAGKKVNYYVGTPVIYDASGEKLSVGKDFTIQYYAGSDNREIEKTAPVIEGMDSIRLIIKGAGGFDGETSATCEITKNDLTPIGKAVVKKPETQSYTGGAITPAVTLFAKGGDMLTEHTDYEILGYYNNVKRGNAFILVRGLGSYTGCRVIPFKIGAAKIAVP